MSGGLNSTGKTSDKKSNSTTNGYSDSNLNHYLPRPFDDDQEISSLEVLTSFDSAKMKDTGIESQLASDLVSPLIKVKTNDTHFSRRTSYAYDDLEDVASHYSHAQSNYIDDSKSLDIDFDKLDEFIRIERQQQLVRSTSHRTTCAISNDSKSIISTKSTSALNYTPKHILYKIKSSLADQINDSSDVSLSDADEKGDGDRVKFNSEYNNGENRYSFYSSDSENTIHSSNLSSLLPANQSCSELFGNKENTWWLDCNNPSESELRALSTTFSIHPLTCEDITTLDCREKVESFKNYYFVSFHTFDSNTKSSTYLKIINFYIIVFKHGILTFHFTPVPHPSVVRRRVNQLRDYVDVTADWLCYALIDDIIDSFAPVIKEIDVEADVIENLVFVCRDKNFGEMLQRIFASRRKIMNLLRLLSFKSDVIKMFKRCQEDLITKRNNQQQQDDTSNNVETSSSSQPPLNSNHPRTEVSLYLDDIQDHVITMHQSLIAYEKMFSKSHSNYLAQLQVESFNANFRITEILSKVTLIGTMLIPLNLVTGLFGMNVVVPGQEVDSLTWFFSIVGFLCLLVTCGAIFGKWWVKSRFDYDSQLPNTA